MARRVFLAQSGAALAGLALADRFAGAKGSSYSAAELAKYDAVGQAQLFKAGDVGAKALIDAAIERTEFLNPKLNCVIYKAFDHAHREAKNAQPTDGPLAGVPYLFKGYDPREGLPNFNCSVIDENAPSAFSGPDARAAESPGMIHIGKTALPEFAVLTSTQSIACGVTENPWDLDRSAAGASGGSGAAVASGMVPLATADDGGGSTRLPAASNGVIGFKYSRGREDREVCAGLSPLFNNGCHTRSVRDQAHYLDAREVKSGHLLEPVGFVAGPSKRRLRVAFSTTGTDETLVIDSEVTRQIRETAALLENLGHTVEGARFPIWGAEFWYHFMAYWTGAGAQIVEDIAQRLEREVTPEDADAWTRGLAESFTDYPDSAYDDATRYFAALRHRFHEWMASYDLWLTPTSSEPADLNAQQDPLKRNYEELKIRVMQWDNFAPLGNALGLPSCALSLGQADAGLPVGSLFNGPSASERTILQLAYELEEARPWKDRWPGASIVAMS